SGRSRAHSRLHREPAASAGTWQAESPTCSEPSSTPRDPSRPPFKIRGGRFCAARIRLLGDHARKPILLHDVMVRCLANHQLDFWVGMAWSEDKASAFRTNLLVVAHSQRHPLHTLSR